MLSREDYKHTLLYSVPRYSDCHNVSYDLSLVHVSDSIFNTITILSFFISTVISARQVSMDTLSLFNESIIFPLEEHLVNHTPGVVPAQITIPTELLTQSLNTTEGSKT